jgi:hypothetical protein
MRMISMPHTRKINVKVTLAFTFLLAIAFTSYAQKYNYPGEIEIRNFKIGDQVDTALYKKLGDLYFPNYLDGWTMFNFDKLPRKYSGLPIAIWELKSDSGIVLTLLNDIILNITVSYIKEDEKDQFCKMFVARFGAGGKEKLYKERHPLQAWITYWNLKTWETNDVIAQIGYSHMRMPKDPAPTTITWNLAYSDFILENKIISDYKNKK